MHSRRSITSVAPPSLGHWLFWLGVLLALSAVLPVSTAIAAVPSAGDLVHGKTVFLANCSQCHGPNAAGGRTGD